MKTYECIAIKDLTGNVTSILLFGLIRPVMPQNRKFKNMDYYCNAVDKERNIYQVFTDYDPCLQISYTVAYKQNK